MQLYKGAFYNAVDKSNGEKCRGVYYVHFLNSQSCLLPITFFFHLIHSPGFHWSVLDEILTTTCSFEANIKMVIDFDVSIV